MNYALPSSTLYEKRMPKEKFYAHLEITPALKRSFVDDIDFFVWKNKLSPSTINIAEGDKVKEIALFEVTLKKKEYNPAIFELIDKNVPVYVVYVLKFENEVRLLASYKEPNPNKQKNFKLHQTFVSDWINEKDVSLPIEGLNLDAVYEGFVRHIAGNKLQEKLSDNIADDIAEQQRRAKIERQIAALQVKQRNEKQFNKQIAISAEIKKLRLMLNS